MPDHETYWDGCAGPCVPFINVQVRTADTGKENPDLYLVDAHLRLRQVFQPKSRSVLRLHKCFHDEAFLTRSHTCTRKLILPACLGVVLFSGAIPY